MGAGAAFILFSIASVSIGFWLGGFWILILPGLVAFVACYAALLDWMFPKVKVLRHSQVQQEFKVTVPQSLRKVVEEEPSLPSKHSEQPSRGPAQPNQTLKLRSAIPAEFWVERPYERDIKALPSMSQPIRPAQPAFVPFPEVTVRVVRDIPSIPTITIATFVSPLVGDAMGISSAPQIKGLTRSDAMRVTRLPKKVISPEHYRRHERTPGHLYIARNDQHRDGLYKMGYTTLETPEKRIASLNDQHKNASDVGVFQLVFSVPTGASYLSEQALFDYLPRFRVAEKREYFYGPLDHFTAAARSAARLSFGDASALNAMYAKDDELIEEAYPFPEYLRTAHCSVRCGDGGWIYVCRNKWHQEDIHYVGCTKRIPYKKRDALNATQKEFTCQIGFYEVIACFAVQSVPTTKRKLLLKIKPHQVVANESFYRISMPSLVSAIDAAISVTTNSTSMPVAPTYRMTKARKGWVDCPDCLTTFQVHPNDVSFCPECGWAVALED